VKIINLIRLAFLPVLVSCGGGSGGGDGSIGTTIAGPDSLSLGTLGTFTAETNASMTAEFEWTLTETPDLSDTPERLLPIIDSDGDQVVFAGYQFGSYTLQLIVEDGGVINPPVLKTFEMVVNGDQPAREMLQIEIDNEADYLFSTDIQPVLTLPGSYRVVGDPTFEITGKDVGELTIVFESQNRLGAFLRNTAVCDYVWTSGVLWFPEFNENLRFCVFL